MSKYIIIGVNLESNEKKAAKLKGPSLIEAFIFAQENFDLYYAVQIYDGKTGKYIAYYERDNPVGKKWEIL